MTAIVLSTYYTSTQLKNAEERLHEQGVTLTRYIANASEYGVFAGSPELFTPIIESALNEKNVVSITITDSNDNILAHKEQKSAINKTSNIIFSQPIFQTQLEVDEITNLQQGDTPTTPTILGQVFVHYSAKEMIDQQRSIILSTILITIFGITLGTLLALHFSEKITNPILRLTRKVQDIEAGKLDASIDTYSPGEIGVLEQGIHSMQTAINNAQLNLKKEVKQATNELEKSLQLLGKQNQELYKARQEALEASKTKSAFLANMSHEIRTPMNGILGFIRLLRESGLKDSQNTYLDIVEVSANNLLNLINDILDISKIEAGKLSLRNKEFNLSQLIEDTLTLLAPTAQEKGVELVSIDYDDIPYLTFGDPDRIRQILLNLLSNAIKFSDSGSVVVRAILEEENSDGCLIKLTVSDEGIGISDTDKEKLFNQFTQLNSVLAQPPTGTGLGLAISKSLANLMGGEIGVVDNQPKGSTFWFTFHTKPIESGKEQLLNARLLSYKHILVFDENPYVRLACRHLIAPYSASIIECDSIDCILHSVIANHLDIIFCGFNLADQDPLAMCIQEIRKFSSVPIVLIANTTDPMVAIDFYHYGDIKFMPKPLNSRELNTALNAIFLPLRGNEGQHTGTKNSAHTDTRERSQEPFHGINILIAEDNEINLQLMTETFEGLGAGILSVSTGKEAVEAFMERAHDIILMDVQMPELNGLEATRSIRELETNGSRIPIIGITASLLSGEEDSYLSAGMDAILLKPVTKEALVDTITSILGLDTRAREIQNTDTSQAAHTPPKFRHPLDILKQQLPGLIDDFVLARNNNETERLKALLHKFIGGLAYCKLPHMMKIAEKVYYPLNKNEHVPDKEFESLISEMQSLTASAPPPASPSENSNTHST